MEWFKHSTSSHDDPDISDAMDRFGHAGYSVFFMTLEVYGDEFNHLDSDGWLKLSKRFVARKLRNSSGKVEQILNFYSERQRIIVKTEGDYILINCPKFIDIASNWTKREKPKPEITSVGTSVVPTAKEEEEEKKKNKEKKKREKKITATINPLPSFSSFWELYPRKEDRRGAIVCWNALNPDDTLLQNILTGLKKQVGSGKFDVEQKYIPLPTTWLNQHRWEDVIDSCSKSDDEMALLDRLMKGEK